MKPLDTWGRNPSVRAMRGVFGLMESFQNRFLEQLRIDPYDPRLRVWRDKAKRDFERSYAEAAGDQIQWKEEHLATIYLRCLANVMRKDGIMTPNNGMEESSALGAALDVETDR